MSDDIENALGDDGGEGAPAPKKKLSGLAALLPNLFKFIAIGLGALIFIVTVAVVTFNIMSKGGKSQTAVVDPTSPYVGKRPEYSNYTLIGQVTTRTRDRTVNTVTVDVILQYDLNNAAAQSELIARQYDLRDFMRRYFSSKYAAELAPEHEERLKRDIQETLNTRFLDTAKVRNVLFLKLDMLEMP